MCNWCMTDYTHCPEVRAEILAPVYLGLFTFWFINAWLFSWCSNNAQVCLQKIGTWILHACVNVGIIHQLICYSFMGECNTGITSSNNMISVILEDFLLLLKATNYTMAKSVHWQGCQTILTMTLVSFFLFPTSIHLSPWAFTDREVTSKELIYWILTQSLHGAYSPQFMLLLSVPFEWSWIMHGCSGWLAGTKVSLSWIKAEQKQPTLLPLIYLLTYDSACTPAACRKLPQLPSNIRTVSCAWLTSKLFYLGK